MEPNKKKKVIDLTVIDQLIQSGVDAIALVEDPAIEINFLAFKKELFVKPTAGESEGDFIGRCMSAIEGEFPDQDQRLAVCYSYWEGGFEEGVPHYTADGNLYEGPTHKGPDGRLMTGATHTEDSEYLYHEGELPFEFESYDDYPEAAKNNAQRALDWAEENGWGSCGTPVGKVRANQLAKGEPISEETISRMASFARHKQNSDTPYGEGCGGLMWDAWGGTEGIEWASRKLDQIEKEKLEVVVNAPPYVDQTGESNKKKKKPILEARPVLMSADEELLLAYFSHVGMSTDEYNLEFANAELMPWQEGDIMPADGAGGRTYYKYVGPPAERDFCRQMLALDRLYTFDEIETAGGFAVNPGFGERGAATYDIWKYKGGPNCKHRWQKFYAKPDGSIENKGPATGKAGVPMYDQANHGYLMSKVYFGEEGDKRILVGPAMVPDMEIPRYDKKTKEVYYVAFSKDAVAKIAEKFMREQSTHNTNQDHDMEKPADTYIFESWIVEDPVTDKANTVYGYDVPVGTWMVKMRVNSDAVWQRVKSGELKGFSVEGNFVTEEELAEIEAAGLLSKISEIVA
jgi:hypothetical protein